MEYVNLKKIISEKTLIGKIVSPHCPPRKTYTNSGARKYNSNDNGNAKKAINEIPSR